MKIFLEVQPDGRMIFRCTGGEIHILRDHALTIAQFLEHACFKSGSDGSCLALDLSSNLIHSGLNGDRFFPVESRTREAIKKDL